MPRYTRSTRARTYSSWKLAGRRTPIHSFSYRKPFAKPRKVWSRKTVGGGYKKKTYKKRTYGRKYRRR